MATGTVQPVITVENVLAAAKRIEPLVRRTPVEASHLFNEAAGVDTYFKCENLQRGGAFKMRGAANFLLSLSEEERKNGVVAYSSGNHAQAVAIAASDLDVAATIVMPLDAPKAKVESTRANGAAIVRYDRFTESREEIAKGIAAKTNAAIVPPYDHPWIIAGQGTAALELLDDCPDLDALAVCVGGGGLLAGTITAAKALMPHIRIFGVEPELAADTRDSFRAGKRIEHPPSTTIADGLRTPQPGAFTFPIIKELAEDILTVSEEEIKSTLRFLLTRMKLLVEPSGAVSAAAVLHHKLPKDVRSVGVILSGGNVDLDVLAAICQETHV